MKNNYLQLKIGKKQEGGLYHNWIPFIREDKQGNLWFASMTHGGVNLFDGEKFSKFKYNKQVFSNVFFIVDGLEGNIWFGGRNGIWNLMGKQ